MKIAAEKSFGFIAQRKSRCLILGSFPSQQSLSEQRYYANPRNQFWPIIAALFSTSGLPENYQKRLQLIENNNLALWDVIYQCKRPGSLDSNIVKTSLLVNDFSLLFKNAPNIKNIFFNGKTAEKLFKTHVLKQNPSYLSGINLHVLPSTSPAHAKLAFNEKLALWSSIKSY